MYAADRIPKGQRSMTDLCKRPSKAGHGQLVAYGIWPDAASSENSGKRQR